MSRRPPIDLLSLTSETASPMPEAMQRLPVSEAKTKPRAAGAVRPEEARTENLEALAFKVPAAFRKRFKQRAVTADLKLNELLFESLEAWEKMNSQEK